MSPFRTSISARRLLLVSLAALMLGAGLSACGSSGSATGATAGAGGTSSSRTQARLNLAKCFRAHGLNVPDPSTGGGPAGGGGGVFRALNGYSRAQVQAAMTACRSVPRPGLSPDQPEPRSARPGPAAAGQVRAVHALSRRQRPGSHLQQRWRLRFPAGVQLGRSQQSSLPDRAKGVRESASEVRARWARWAGWARWVTEPGT